METHPAEVTPSELAYRFLKNISRASFRTGIQGIHLAHTLGLSKESFRRIFMGLKLPSWEQLCLIANELGMDPVSLLLPPDEPVVENPMTDLASHLEQALDAMRRLHAPTPP